MDWKDKLSALSASLPAGDDIASETKNTNETLSAQPKQNLLIEMEKKGRGGKTATIISGFTLPDDEVTAIAAEMKKKLGIGGSARGSEILLQGDARDKAVEFLKGKGWGAKRRN